MDTAIERRISTQRAEDLRRLADRGERNGVRILVDPRTGQHVATSASDPTRCYHVSAGGGCTCKGYGTWGRCQHHSLLLSELGQIPDEGGLDLTDLLWGDVVAFPPRRRCPWCGGEGLIHDPEGRQAPERCPEGCPVAPLRPVALAAA